LRDHLESDIDAVDYALYWIPYRRQLSVRGQAALRELTDLFELLKQK